jgi:hypothetical protein
MPDVAGHGVRIAAIYRSARGRVKRWRAVWFVRMLAKVP